MNSQAKAQQQAKEKLAKRHLQSARQHGKTLIGQTNQGTVRLTFTPPRRYTLERLGTVFTPIPLVLAQGRKSVVQPVLISLYVDQAQ